MTSVRFRGVTTRKGLLKNEEGVSPVIGTILMVAVTVMLSGGVYVWTTVFNSDTPAPESATFRATGIDRDDNGLVEWIRVTLVSGNDAPYHHDVVGLQVLPPVTEMLDDSDLCVDPAVDSTFSCVTLAGDENNTAWQVGQSLFIPCQEKGKHMLTLTVRGHTVLDNTVQCGEKAVP